MNGLTPFRLLTLYQRTHVRLHIYMADVHRGRALVAVARTGLAAAAAAAAAMVVLVTTPAAAFAAGTPSPAPSAEVTATPATTPATTPGAPAGLAVAPGPTQVTLSWTAPAADGGAAVTGYRVYQGSITDFSHGTLAGTVTGTRAAVTGLTGGTSYWFRVAAVNAAGQGTWSVPVMASVPSATGSETPSGPPPSTPPPLGAPTGLTAALGDAQVRLDWSPPASDGGAPVTHYHLYLATNSGSRASAEISDITGTSAMVAGLTNGVTYYFTVAAVNAADREGPISAEVSARPGPATMMTLTSAHVPNQLIAWLAVLSVTALAGALALAVVGRRMNARVRVPK